VLSCWAVRSSACLLRMRLLLLLVSLLVAHLQGGLVTHREPPKQMSSKNAKRAAKRAAKNAHLRLEAAALQEERKEMQQQWEKTASEKPQLEAAWLAEQEASRQKKAESKKEKQSENVTQQNCCFSTCFQCDVSL